MSRVISKKAWGRVRGNASQRIAKVEKPKRVLRKLTENAERARSKSATVEPDQAGLPVPVELHNLATSGTINVDRIDDNRFVLTICGPDGACEIDFRARGAITATLWRCG